MHFKIKRHNCPSYVLLGRKTYFVQIHILTKLFENLKVITYKSAVRRFELGNNMCMLTRSIQRKDE